MTMKLKEQGYVIKKICDKNRRLTEKYKLLVDKYKLLAAKYTPLSKPVTIMWYPQAHKLHM